MRHFGTRQLWIFMLLLDIAIFAVQKCIYWSEPSQHTSSENNREIAKKLTGRPSLSLCLKLPYGRRDECVKRVT